MNDLTVAFAVTETQAGTAAGDYYSARELGEACRRQFGLHVRYLPKPDWYALDGVDIIVAMTDHYDLGKIAGARPDAVKICWMRNWFDRWAQRPSFPGWDLYLCSSQKAVDYLRARHGITAALVRIATNAGRFSAATPFEQRDIDCCFTGSYWDAPRDIEMIDPDTLGCSFAVFGRNWERHPTLHTCHRGFIPYEQLPRLYGRTKILLDDANHATKPWGSVNSRVFDALAAGALVITNSIESSHDVFDGGLPVYDSPAGLKDMINRYLRDPALYRRTTERLRQAVLERHTYEIRAAEFMQVLARHFAAAGRPAAPPAAAACNTGAAASMPAAAHRRPPARNSPRVSIIIPVFNKVEYTVRCLQALAGNTPGDVYEVLVVDNASTDGTREFLHQIGGDITIITRSDNRGFACANNQAALRAQGEYLLFLNNDTEVRTGWLEPLLRTLDQDPSVAAAGAQLLYPDGTLQHAGVIIIEQHGKASILPRHVFSTMRPEACPCSRPMSLQALTAACLLVRKADFDSAGGFDEGYRNGCEDVDLCFRLRRLGRQLIYQPASIVVHHESKSGPERFAYIAHNNRRLQERWKGVIQPDLIDDGTRVHAGPAGSIMPYSAGSEHSAESAQDFMQAALAWWHSFPHRRPHRRSSAAARPVIIKTCTPTPHHRGWGDTFFARTIANAFSAKGSACRVDFRSQWQRPSPERAVVIHVKGRYQYLPRPEDINILWIISHPELHTLADIEQFDLVLCASQLYAEHLVRSGVSAPCHYLPQATDEHLFVPPAVAPPQDIDVLFVGNNYYKTRPRQIIRDLLDTGVRYDLHIVGKFWEGVVDAAHIKGEYVPWEQLPSLYSRAKIVLNDHHATMRQHGFINNRTYDLAAMRAFQISDKVHGLDQLGVVTYAGADDLRGKLNRYLARRSEREQIARAVHAACARETFTARAATILEMLHSGAIADKKSNRRPGAGQPRPASAPPPGKPPGPFISICIPAYNRAAFLKDSVQSALNQTYRAFEIVLVDDGSTDDTQSAVASLASGNIRCIRKEHSGAPDTRNRCIHEARGDFILWLDSDDLLDSSLLSEYVHALSRHPDADILYCNIQTFSDGAGPRSVYRYHDWYHNPAGMLHYFTKGNPLPNPGAMIRKSLFDGIGLYDTAFARAHDLELWSRVVLAGRYRAKHIRKTLYHLRFHADNLTGKKDPVRRDFRYEQKVLHAILAARSLEEIFYNLDWTHDPRAAAAKAHMQIVRRFVHINDLQSALHYCARGRMRAPDDAELARMQRLLQQRQQDFIQQYKVFAVLGREGAKGGFADYLRFLRLNLGDAAADAAAPGCPRSDMLAILKEQAAKHLSARELHCALYVHQALSHLLPGNQDLSRGVAGLQALLGNPRKAAGSASRAQNAHPPISPPRESLPATAPDDGRSARAVDFLAWEPHHFSHLLPIWDKIPLSRRGSFYIVPLYDPIDRFAIPEGCAGISLWHRLDRLLVELNRTRRHLVYASYYREQFLRHIQRPLVYIEHGAGQSYLGAPLHLFQRLNTVLDILPNEILARVHAQRYPGTRQAVVGSPVLDRWHRRPRKSPGPSPVIALSFHFDRKTLPETRSAFEHFKAALPRLAARGGWKVLGHGHPRIIEQIAPHYEQLGIDVVRSFEEVMERADLYICDNSSTLYEFASTGRPVVVLNAPWYRREVEHGLRFWEYADVGVNCDDPADLIRAIETALADPPRQRRRRDKAVRAVYAYTDGNASERAAREIVRCADAGFEQSDAMLYPATSSAAIDDFFNSAAVDPRKLRAAIALYSRRLQTLFSSSEAAQRSQHAADAECCFWVLALLAGRLGRIPEARDFCFQFYQLCGGTDAMSVLYRRLLLEPVPGTRAPKTSPKVSVIIPLFNQGRYLEEALASVVRQTYAHWEIIIVNDGSTDDSYAVALRLQQQYAGYPISVVSHANRGKGFTRNRGIRESTGRYVCVLDADDMLASTYLDVAVAMLERDQGIGWVVPQTLQFGRVHQLFYTWPEHDFVRALLICPAPVTSIYRKEMWEALSGYAEDMIDREDWDFWIRAGEMGFASAATKDVQFMYRIHRQQWGHRPEINIQSKLQLIARHPRWYKKLPREALVEIFRKNPYAGFPPDLLDPGAVSRMRATPFGRQSRSAQASAV